MSEKPLDLEDIENEILSIFEREKLRLLSLSKEKIDWNNYYVGRFEELGVLKRMVRTLLKEKELIKQQIQEVVQGLLDELICEVKSIENQGRHIYDDYYSGLRDGYLIAIKIIKKYFPEEVKENDERK